MTDFADLVRTIKRLQSQAKDDPELVEFVAVQAKLHGRSPEDVMREFQTADPVQLANSYYAQLNEGQAQDAFDSARRGDSSHIKERIDVGLATPAEEKLYFGKNPRGRPETRRARDARIYASIEALRAAGLKKREAIGKASELWGRHLSVTPTTIADIHKKQKLPKTKADDLRNFFAGATVDEVLAAIEDYCRTQK